MKAQIDDLTGRTLGAYRIVSQVGAGGMAAVYKAYQSSMDRYVAVKVLPKNMASDPQFTGRFENEARVLARLQHPHILPVFDFGQAEGYAFFVMPLVETGTLAQRLQGRPVPLLRLRTFVSQIGDALDYAHSRGLLHRDVKPSNVLVDERENYLLTDFGIAKLVDGTSNLTATGTLIGTPAYMSPEQGQGRNVDRRSDIYSLGVIIYELAAGRVPFVADTPVAVIFKHVTEQLPPIESLNPNLPPQLVQIIYHALEKQPEDRFQTARELVDAVEATIDDTPDTPRPPLAATMLEPYPSAPPAPSYHTNRPATGAIPPGATIPPSGPVGTSPSPLPANPLATNSMPANPATPPPSLVGNPPSYAGTGGPPSYGGTNPATGMGMAPPPPARRNWTGAILGLGGVGIIGLIGLVLLGCLGAYLLAPQLFAGILPVGPGATRTPARTATVQATQADATETPEPVDEPTRTPRPSRTPEPDVTEAPTEEIFIPSEDSLYFDDFEDTGSGWREAEEEGVTVGYADGEYSIAIDDSGTFMPAYAPAGDFANVHIAVTILPVDIPQDAPGMGIICDIQDSGAYYYMGFSADGYYAIIYYDGNESNFLTNAENKKEWSPTDGFAKYGDSYLLEGDCDSDGTLRLTVDGEVLAEVVDTNLNSGGVGIFTTTFDGAPVDVHFDDFEITQGEGPEVLYSTDFSEADTWWTGGDEDHHIDVVDGRYLIHVNSPNLIAWGNPEIDISNAHFSVTAWNEARNAKLGFGIICNYQADTGEYYFMGVGSDGYYAITFYDGEETHVLTSSDNTWTKSSDITIGDVVYQVEADCGGDGTLRLTVDGTEIATVQSDTYTSGDIGLFVQTWDNVPAEVAFDDLTITALP